MPEASAGIFLDTSGALGFRGAHGDRSGAVCRIGGTLAAGAPSSYRSPDRPHGKSASNVIFGDILRRCGMQPRSSQGSAKTAPGPTTPSASHNRSATASVSLDNLASRGDIPYEVSGAVKEHSERLPSPALSVSKDRQGSKVRHDCRRDRRRKRPNSGG